MHIFPAITGVSIYVEKLQIEFFSIICYKIKVISIRFAEKSKVKALTGFSPNMQDYFY